MGLDILAIGVILLANPYHVLTDFIAAVIIAAATRRGEDMLRDFKKMSLYSYGLIAIGAMEIIFKFAFPSELITNILTVCRYGIIAPIEICLVSGLSDLAIILENAEMHRKATNFRKPIYFSAIIAVCLVALATVWPAAKAAAIIWKIFVSFITAMIAITLCRSHKELTKPNIFPEDNEGDDKKS